MSSQEETMVYTYKSVQHEGESGECHKGLEEEKPHLAG